MKNGEIKKVLLEELEILNIFDFKICIHVV
jgi:hypothetical protein